MSTSEGPATAAGPAAPRGDAVVDCPPELQDRLRAAADSVLDNIAPRDESGFRHRAAWDRAMRARLAELFRLGREAEAFERDRGRLA